MGNGVVIFTGPDKNFRSPRFSPAWRVGDGLEHEVSVTATLAAGVGAGVDLPYLEPDPRYPDWKQIARNKQIARLARSRKAAAS